MIRLTLTIHTQPSQSEIHLFDKATLLMGNDSSLVDLDLGTASSYPIHFKIVCKDNSTEIINEANDPFATLNQNPFGKAIIHSGDTLNTEGFSLLFEEIHTQSAHSLPQNSDKEVSPHSTQQAKPLVSRFTLPFEGEIVPFSEEEWKTFQTNPLFLDKNLSIELNRKSSLKDDYLKSLDDESSQEINKPVFDNKEPSHLIQAWKWILLFIFSLFALFGAVGTVIYYSMSDKAEAQETKALQGTADIAMALTYAHINQIKPNNHNLSDSEFLKTNLQALLFPTTPSYALSIDSQGQFNSFPYTLRIYTSSDLSHFVLITQPAPSLLNWLFPPSLIAVDSHLMELHAIKDVGTLNRLLDNPDPLEGNNGQELTELIEEGKLITLESLAIDSGTDSFAPPDAISLIYPQAANRLCNAPRYYKMGQHVLSHAIDLCLSKNSCQSLNDLNQKIEHCAHLTPWIIYSDQGEEEALMARRGLNIFSPHEGFLFGYLLFDAHTSRIKSACLLPQECDENGTHDHAEIAMEEIPNEEKKEAEELKTPDDPPYQNHPIYIHLHEHLSLREKELSPLVQCLTKLIEDNLSAPLPSFESEFEPLAKDLLMMHRKHDELLNKQLDFLYKQYPNTSPEELTEILNVLNIHLLQKVVFNPQESDLNHEIELLLKTLDQTQSMIDLNTLVEKLDEKLTPDYMEDLSHTLKYQETLRNILLDKLEKFLEDPHTHLSFTFEEKEALMNILAHEKFIMEDEKEFFKERVDQINN